MRSWKYLSRSIAMEMLKIKTTLVVWLAVLAPAFVVVVAFVAGYADGGKFYKPGSNPWINFSEHILAGWSLFILPIYVSLQSALYAAIEHQNRAWTYVYNLPVPKWSIYISKLLMLTGLVGLSHIVLLALGEAGGLLLGALKPGYGFQNFSDHGLLISASCSMFICALGIVMIQLLISICYPSFIVPAGFGLFATLSGVMARWFPVSHFSPYLWSFSFLNNTTVSANWDYSFLLTSIVLYIAGAVMSIWILNRRDVR